MTVTLYDKHHLRTQQPQLRYFCETRGPDRTIQIPKGHDRTSLLSLSAEIRNIIYEYATTIEGIIGFDVLSHEKPALLSDAWRQRKDLAACFNLLSTCKSIYAEAKPVFWGQNTFELVVKVAGRVPRHPAPRDLVPTQWRKWLPVASPQHRKLIKKVTVTIDDVWSQSVMPKTDTPPQPGGIPTQYLLTSAIDVQELAINLDAVVSRRASVPVPDMIYQLQHDGLLSHTDVHNLLHVTTDSQDADYLIYYIMQAISSITCKCCSMPQLQNIRLTGTVIVDCPNGEWKRYWNGFDVANFCEDKPLACILAAWAESVNIDFRFETPKLRSGICGRCKQEWMSHKWVVSKTEMICPRDLLYDGDGVDNRELSVSDLQNVELQWLRDYFEVDVDEQEEDDD